MGPRFTLKDLLLFSLLAVVIVLVVLAMYQVDRQWQKLADIQSTLQEQAADLRRLRQSVHEMPRTPADRQGAADATGAVPPAFQRAYQATRQPGYAQGGWIVQAFAMGLKTLTPFVSTDAYASEIQNYILESLLTRDPDTLAWQGLLARDWTVSKDGLKISFDLRRNATFSDGKPVTSADVVFTYHFIMNPAIAAPRERAYYDKIKRVYAEGPGRVVFEFKEPYFNSLALAGGMPILAKHYYESYLKQPEKFNQSKALLFGSGPYRLKEGKDWTPDVGLVELDRNPRYWGPVQPAPRRLIWKIIENDSARLTTFRNGDIDVYGARPREYKQLVADKALAKRTRHFEYLSPTAGYSYIGWNESRKDKPTWFADRRVRLAMTYLTDRAGIIRHLMQGYAEPAVSPFIDSSPQHDPALKPRLYDLARAKQLLREAGFRDRNGDGVLEDAKGRPFKFKMTFFQGSEDTRRIALYLKDLYARAGIVMQPAPTEWAVMLDKIKHRDFDAIMLGWTSGVEVDIYQMFDSSQIENGGDNFIGYRNPKLDRLITEARGTVDEAKRMPLWQACERILYHDQPYTFLMRRKSLVFVDRRIHNLQVTKLGLNLGLVPMEIYIPSAEQKYTD
ncbi:MAG: peptide-binding protein [Gammaproteobacteria bacterium]|jgi:peptide/nickel transport system substrate-binding protein